ncbi:DUF1364 family protein [Halomonas shantousis]
MIRPKIRSQKIRDAARGEECTLQIPGICNHNPDTTVLAHLPSETNGMGTKSSDVSSCFACSSCHDAIDRRTCISITDEEREFYMRRGQARTIERLYAKGVISIQGAA